MPLLQSRAAPIALIVLVSVWTGSAVRGSDPDRFPPSETRQPPTVLKTILYLYDGKEAMTVANLSSWTGTKPIRVRPGRYHWQLADGMLLTLTTATDTGEEIGCWVRVK